MIKILLKVAAVLGKMFLKILTSVPGLPDGRKPESQFRYIMGLGMENVGIQIL
jgi:hypothetical protein